MQMFQELVYQEVKTDTTLSKGNQVSKLGTSVWNRKQMP